MLQHSNEPSSRLGRCTVLPISPPQHPCLMLSAKTHVNDNYPDKRCSVINLLMPSEERGFLCHEAQAPLCMQMHVSSVLAESRASSTLLHQTRAMCGGPAQITAHAWTCMHPALPSGAPCITATQPASLPVERPWLAPTSQV